MVILIWSREVAHYLDDSIGTAKLIYSLVCFIKTEPLLREQKRQGFESRTSGFETFPAATIEPSHLVS